MMGNKSNYVTPLVDYIALQADDVLATTASINTGLDGWNDDTLGDTFQD